MVNTGALGGMRSALVPAGGHSGFQSNEVPKDAGVSN